MGQVERLSRGEIAGPVSTWELIMTRHYVRFLVIFSTAIFGSVLWIAAAHPPSQGPLIPTPTLYPVENVSYMLDQVGGEDLTLTFDHAAANGITPGTTTVTSQYPRGMTFTLAPHSDNGEIQNVTLFVRYPHGSGTRAIANYDADSNTWIVLMWESGAGQPAWTHFDFYWRIRDTSGATLDTAPEAIDYWDSTRVWFRLESDDMILYWYGFFEDDPDRYAQMAANAMAATEQRRLAGFGHPISYKSIAVIYGNRSGWNEIYASGISRPMAGGITSDQLGMTIQYAPANNSIYQASWINQIITHEITHLYQHDLMNGNRGPEWWYEGQATWFSTGWMPYDTRLMSLATVQDIPSITTSISRETIQADGEPFLNYDVGTSFVNWFVATYGINSHAAVVALMRDESTNFYEAVEIVTGENFLDIENKWRTYLGFRPLTLAEIDPESALQPAIDPIAALGNIMILPATPAMPVLHSAPGSHQLTSGQCFANTPVEILAVGSLDGVDYYQVDCMGQIGWMSRGELVGPEN